MVQRYRIENQVLAAVVERGAWKLIVVPSASVIDVPLALDRLEGLIEVTYKNKSVLMFAEDIRERGTPISEASA